MKIKDFILLLLMVVGCLAAFVLAEILVGQRSWGQEGKIPAPVLQGYANLDEKTMQKVSGQANAPLSLELKDGKIIYTHLVSFNKVQDVYSAIDKEGKPVLIKLESSKIAKFEISNSTKIMQVPVTTYIEKWTDAP